MYSSTRPLKRKSTKLDSDEESADEVGTKADGHGVRGNSTSAPFNTNFVPSLQKMLREHLVWLEGRLDEVPKAPPRGFAEVQAAKRRPASRQRVKMKRYDAVLLPSLLSCIAYIHIACRMTKRIRKGTSPRTRASTTCLVDPDDPAESSSATPSSEWEPSTSPCASSRPLILSVSQSICINLIRFAADGFMSLRNLSAEK